MDAKRRSDGALVAIKSTRNSEEIRIAQYLSSLRDPQNHCVPVLDVFADPSDPQSLLLVMPYLRQFNDPNFSSVGEVIDFVDQTMEVRNPDHLPRQTLTTIQGLAFLHRNLVAHR